MPCNELTKAQIPRPASKGAKRVAASGHSSRIQVSKAFNVESPY